MVSLAFLCHHALLNPTSSTNPHIDSEEDRHSFFIVDNTFFII